MLDSTECRELRNGKRYQKSIERIMSKYGSTEEVANRSSLENVKREFPEFQTMTQEAFNEQIRGFCRSPDSPARGVDSASTRNEHLTASEFLPQD